MPTDAVRTLMKDADQHMLEAIESVKRDFATIRTGRANPAILDRIRVEYFGQQSPVNQVATISAPEPRLLVISPWDKQMIKPITDAITSSDLGLNPNNDGNVIRVPLPQLTTERRKELAKLVAKKTEDGRISIRNIRRDVVEKLRTMQKHGDISEDDLKRYQDQAQKVTDGHITQLEHIHTAKEKELIEG